MGRNHKAKQMIMGLLFILSIALQGHAQELETIKLAIQLQLLLWDDDNNIIDDANTLSAHLKEQQQKQLEKLEKKAEKWIEEGRNSYNIKRYEESVEKAAQLPSYKGLQALGEWYQLLGVEQPSYIKMAHECYRQQKELFGETSYDAYQLADFYKVTSCGDTIYYSFGLGANLFNTTVLGVQFEQPNGAETGSVWVTTPSKFHCNTTGERLVIPEKIFYEDKCYRVTKIHESAFRNDTALRHVTLPETLTFIDFYAFKDCINLDTIVFRGGNLTTIKNAAIPPSTTLILPHTMSREMAELMYSRCSTYDLEQLSSMFYGRKRIWHSCFNLANQLKDCDSLKTSYRINCLTTLGLLCFDPVINDPQRAIGYWQQAADMGDYESLRDIADYYHYVGDYAKAFEFYQQAYSKGDSTISGNKMALMYAKGEYVKQDFHKALQLIDGSIDRSKNKHESVWINLKGCIYLMMGLRDKAEACYQKVPKGYHFFTQVYFMDREFPQLANMLFPEKNISSPNLKHKRYQQFNDEKIQCAIWLNTLLAKAIWKHIPHGRYWGNLSMEGLVLSMKRHIDSISTTQYTEFAILSYNAMRKTLGDSYQWYAMPKSFGTRVTKETMLNYENIYILRPIVMLHKELENIDTTTLTSEQQRMKTEIADSYQLIDKMMGSLSKRDRNIFVDLIFHHVSPSIVEHRYNIDASYIKQLLTLKQ